MKLVRIENLQSAQPLFKDEFLQSDIWGKILTREGAEIEYWGAQEGSKILASALLIKKALPGPFYYYYGPRGPVGEQSAAQFLLSELKKEKSKAVFLRIEPEEMPEEIGVGKVQVVLRKDLKKTVDLQPKKTLMLDLSLGQEELLKAMHPKTRYNIKLAEKKGVEITQGTEKDLAEFWRLMKLTGERDAFRLHDAKHYQNLLSEPKYIKLFLASYEGRNIATGLFCFFGASVTYLHGASDNEARNLMAPYLLQWEVIKQAQKEAYKFYDFYGIDKKKWPGVTRFKVGFGGFIKEYPGTYDFIFRPVIYGLYEALRKLRRKIK